MLTHASWIGFTQDFGTVCPTFARHFHLDGQVKSAALTVTCKGVYEAHLNGRRVGDFILAPGCTSYRTRLQVQTYDVTALLKDGNDHNLLEITVGTGWHRGRISERDREVHEAPCALIAELSVEYADGHHDLIPTDTTWQVRRSPVLFSDIYDGETYDARVSVSASYPVQVLALDRSMLIPQEGERVIEQQRIHPISVFTTPRGERVIDFGQIVTGYVTFTVDARDGDEIRISHAEVLDASGNFYTDNYRSAKAKLHYICRDGVQTYKPHFTFFGFRYIRLDQWPGQVNPADFAAIAVYSEIRRTGFIETGHDLVNRLFDNVLWSQRGNFLDVPTDCPQRDERMGWTGDAQAFCKTACCNYDVLRFMKKWLRDLCAEQRPNGSIPDTVPNFWMLPGNSAAWGDVITILPWQLYMTYGDLSVLEESFTAMCRWVDFVAAETSEPYLWVYPEDQKNGRHYGDWLSQDVPTERTTGGSDVNLIASAFHAYSTELVVKAGHALGRDVSKYEAHYENVVKAFKARFNEPKTQTEHVLLLHFRLTDDMQRIADQLNRMILQNGTKLTTGFVGTPYLLHALSDNGHTDTAWALLMQTDAPSWLYEVTHGATTVWEHWDGINDSGAFWSADMNSYNHYAYGAVIDWVYEQAAGIRPAKPGYERITVAPLPDQRLGWLDVTVDTAQGRVRSAWRYVNGKVRCTVCVPTDADIVIDGKVHHVGRGEYIF